MWTIWDFNTKKSVNSNFDALVKNLFWDSKLVCFLFFIDSALQDEIDICDDEQSQEMLSTENVVRVRVLREEFKPMMTTSIRELRRAGLKIDCFGLHENESSTPGVEIPCTPHKPLSCPLTVLCNDIHAAMKKLQFSVYRGDVYKKVAESQFTFKFLCSMKSFLLNLMGNECFKDRLVQHFQRVLPLLSEPESSLIGQLNIDRNLVEVQNGWFWSFSEGAFVQGVIPESEVRAYVFISKGCFNSVITISLATIYLLAKMTMYLFNRKVVFLLLYNIINLGICQIKCYSVSSYLI